MSGLTPAEIAKLVNRYIGVSGGYLGDFSYRTHADFYTEYCNLPGIDPYELPGTTRTRFIEILGKGDRRTQAAIVRGVLERFPVGQGPATRTNALAQEYLAIAARLEALSPVPSPTLSITSDVVDRAIADAETLLKANGATSGVDRIHTALHGYLLQVAASVRISLPTDPTIPAIFKALRAQHPRLQATGPRATDITQILRSAGSIMDVLLPVRNQASVAHPNANLLSHEEAMLVINVARSLLHYLDSKLK